MTVRELEIEVWKEFAREVSIDVEKVVPTVQKHMGCEDILNAEIPPEELAEVREQMRKIITDVFYLRGKNN
jgi:hypothetical protein